MPILKPTQNHAGQIHCLACGNPRTQGSKLALSFAIVIVATWLCAGGFPGWLERSPAQAALICWSALLLLHLRTLQIRSRRLWLSGSHLVYQSIALGFISDASALTGVQGRQSSSGSLRELVLVRGGSPLLRLRLSDWQEQDLGTLIAALVRLKPSMELDPLVRTYVGTTRPDSGAPIQQIGASS